MDKETASGLVAVARGLRLEEVEVRREESNSEARRDHTGCARNWVLFLRNWRVLCREGV